MALQTDLVREELLSGNADFRRWVEEHAQHEQELETLQAQEKLSPEQELDVIRIKKQKLQLKDQMAEMIQKYRREQSEAVQAT